MSKVICLLVAFLFFSCIFAGCSESVLNPENQPASEETITGVVEEVRYLPDGMQGLKPGDPRYFVVFENGRAILIALRDPKSNENIAGLWITCKDERLLKKAKEDIDRNGPQRYTLVIQHYPSTGTNKVSKFTRANA